MTEYDKVEKSVTNGIRTMLGIGGIVALVVGILVLVWPAHTAAVVTAVIGAYAVVAGIVYVAISLFSKGADGWSRLGHVVLGVLYLIAGIVIFSNLGAATATLAFFVGLLVGVMWIIEGIIALTTLRRTGSPVFTVLFAVLSIVAGIVMLLSPLWGAVVLWWVVGVSLVVLGVIQIVRAFRFGQLAKS